MLLPPHLTKYIHGMLIAIFCFLIVGTVTSFVWARAYRDRIAPNVLIDSVDFGGKSPHELRAWLQKQTDVILTKGIELRLNGESKTLPLATLIGSDLVENVAIDINATVQSAQNAQRDSNFIADTAKLVYSLIRPVEIPVAFTVNKDALTGSVHALFGSQEVAAANTIFVFTHIPDGWQIDVKEGHEGKEIDERAFLQMLETRLRDLSVDSIELALIENRPTVTKEEAEGLVDRVQSILKSAPYELALLEQSWELTAEQLAPMLIPLDQETVGLDKTLFTDFVKPIAESIDHPAVNAKFELQDGRVTEFVGSEDGVKLDQEKVYQDMRAMIQSPSTEAIQLVTMIEKPTISTQAVNGLGITQKLGEGISNYRGSPVNRKKNIQNGVRLLNGLLIAPGETFSLVKALQPFTIENGYLPELVIKGSSIKPEIGGGLCQIGTTTFRAVMNSGFPILERSNHSLVVSYYNDPSNKNPGTDATIYEPAPDFKFTNDTEQYVLLKTENLTNTQQLRFSFWGTSDGRKGSYTPPKVLRWIPVGEPKITETTDLKPGEEKCQEAHIGADASFTYVVEKIDGTKMERVFTSHYRPLPKICLIGVAPKPEISSEEMTGIVEPIPLE